jgi:hypothetical protein
VAGWANDQNLTLQKLNLFIRRASVSGRVLYVDHNRGRDSYDATQTPNDPTNKLYMPGPDSAGLVTTGAYVPAQYFADFHTINAAIVYAANAAGRGEPALSVDYPYIIFIQPGIYVEDVVFRANIHLVGLGSQNILPYTAPAKSVVLRTATTGHQFYTAAAADTVVLKNLQIENTAADAFDVIFPEATSPVFGGVMILDNVHIEQKNVGVGATGNALILGDGTASTSLLMRNSSIRDLSGEGAGHYAVTVDGNAGYLEMIGSDISASLSSALDINTSFAAATYTMTLNTSTVRAEAAGGIALRPLASDIDISYSEIGAVTATYAVYVVGGPKAGDLNLTIEHSHIDGIINFDILAAAGNTTLTLGSVIYDSVSLPNGNPNTSTFSSQGKTVGYIPDLADPWRFNAGISDVPAAQRITGATNVQDALDFLVRMTTVPSLGPSGIVYGGLDSAYDGFSAITPQPVQAAGFGRRIVADAESVQITGSVVPVGSLDPSLGYTVLDGFLEVERGVRVGVLGTPELNIDPNFCGYGPLVGLGELEWNGELAVMGGADPRSLPSAILQGNSIIATAHNYGIRLQTQSTTEVSNGHVGWVAVRGGDASFDAGAGPLPASVYLQAGSYFTTTAHAAVTPAAHVYLTPGVDENPAVPITTPVTAHAGAYAGTVRIVDPTRSTAATLTAAAVCANPVVGVAGTIWFGTPMGPLSVTVNAADTPANVVTAINAAARGLIYATLGGATITLHTYDRGPLADIFYINDGGALGALNTALGDFSLAGGATMTSGTAPAFAEMYCPSAGVLAIGNPAPGTLNLVYNTTTGKLDVPGVIDPIELILDEIDHTAEPPYIAPGGTQGALFVSSGAGGLIQNHLYYEDAGFVFTDISGAAALSGDPKVIYIGGDKSITKGGGTLSFGPFMFNAGEYSGTTFELVATMWTAGPSVGAITATATLYNLTDLEAVATAPAMTTVAAVATEVVGTMTAGPAPTNLQTTKKMYEVRLTATGADAADTAYLGSIVIKVTP